MQTPTSADSSEPDESSPHRHITFPEYPFWYHT